MMELSRKQFVKPLSTLLALSVFMIGAVVIGGWFLKVPLLIQVMPAWVPMQFNTALCFVLSSLSLLCVFKATWVSLLLSAVVLTLGTLTSLQYLLMLSFQIDQLFMEHYITTYSPHPGRMALNTALCFVLTSWVLLLMAWRSAGKWVWSVVAIFSALLAATGAISLFGYFADIYTAYTWGSYSRMAVHTALGFFLMGMSCMLIARSQLLTLSSGYYWYYILFIPFMITSTLCLAVALKANHNKHLQQKMDNGMYAITESLQTQFESVVKTHQLLAEKAISTALVETALTTDQIDPTMKVLPQHKFAFNELALQAWRSATLEIIRKGERFLSTSWIGDELTVLLSVNRQGEPVGLPSRLVAALLDASLVSTQFLDDDGRYWVLTPLRHRAGWLVSELSKTVLFHQASESVYSKGLILTDLYRQKLDTEGPLSAEQPVDAGEVSNESGLSAGAPDRVDKSIVKVFNVRDQKWVAEMAVDEATLAADRSNTDIVILVMVVLLLTTIAYLLRSMLKVLSQKREMALLINWQESTLSSMIEGHVLMNEQGTILDCNAAFASMMGYDAHELLQHPLDSLLDSDSQLSFHAARRQFLSQNHQQQQAPCKSLLLNMVTKEAALLPIKCQVATFLAGSNRYFVSVVSDLSQQQQLDSVLFEKEAILKAAFGSSAAGLSIEAHNAGYVEVNLAFAEWLGLAKSDIIGKIPDHFLYLDNNVERDKIREQLKAGEMTAGVYETKFRHASGELLWAKVCDVVVKSESDDIRYYLSQVIDITEIKQLEFELKRRNQLLSQANEELEQFAFVASHDLKEPVRTLSTYSKLLMEDLEEGELKRAEQDQRFIEDACHRMNTLIDALLYYSKYGYSNMQISSCNLADLLKKVLETLKGNIEQTGSTIKVPDAWPPLEGDEKALSQMFQNLLKNAMTFSREGVQPNIEITWRALSEDRIEIHVKDNGVGIQPEWVDKIFEPFKIFSSGATRLSSTEGVGIGLSLVKKIVERHNGVILVDSEVDVGSTFIISLPTTFINYAELDLAV